MRVGKSPVTAVVIAVLLAVVVVLALLPTRGVDTQPPVCWALGGYEVPCSQAPAWGSGAIVLILGGLVGWRSRRDGLPSVEGR